MLRELRGDPDRYVPPHLRGGPGFNKPSTRTSPTFWKDATTKTVSPTSFGTSSSPSPREHRENPDRYTPPHPQGGFGGKYTPPHLRGGTGLPSSRTSPPAASTSPYASPAFRGLAGGGGKYTPPHLRGDSYTSSTRTSPTPASPTFCQDAKFQPHAEHHEQICENFRKNESRRSDPVLCQRVQLLVSAPPEFSWSSTSSSSPRWQRSKM